MKTWEKPKLIVLVRGKPGETLLEICKTSVATGPETAAGGCALGVGLLNSGCAGSFAPVTCFDVVAS